MSDDRQQAEVDAKELFEEIDKSFEGVTLIPICIINIWNKIFS